MNEWASRACVGFFQWICSFFTLFPFYFVDLTMSVIVPIINHKSALTKKMTLKFQMSPLLSLSHMPFLSLSFFVSYSLLFTISSSLRASKSVHFSCLHFGLCLFSSTSSTSICLCFPYSLLFLFLQLPVSIYSLTFKY